MLKIRQYITFLCLMLPLILVNCTNPDISNNPEAPGNAALSAIVLSEGTLEPGFSADIKDYYVEFGAFVDSIAITATAADSSYDKMLLRLNEADPWEEIKSDIPEILELGMGSNKIEIAITAKDKKTTKTYTIKINNTGNPAADLASLSLSKGNITFNSNTTSYTVFYETYVSSITITAAPTDTNQNVKLELNLNSSSWEEIAKNTPTRALSLVVPTNTILIRVTARDGVTTKEYVLTIINTGNHNANLSALSISSGTLDFKVDTTTYFITYANFVSSINVTANAADPLYNKLQLKLNKNEWIDISSGVPSAALLLDANSNTIQIRVTAQDTTTTKNYIINITNIGSSNAKLSALELSSGMLTPEFNSDKCDYSVFYSVAINSITIKATAADKFYNKIQLRMNGGVWSDLVSGVVSSSQNLWSGPNTAEIRVTAQDTTTLQTYKIAIQNLGNSNANLASIKFSAGTLSPLFNSLNYTYTVNLPNDVMSVKIKPATEFARCSKVEFTSDGATWHPFIDGDLSTQDPIPLSGSSTNISVRVTAEDTITVKTYNFNIKKIDFENWQSRDVPGQASPQAWGGVTMASSNNYKIAAIVKYGNIYTSNDGGSTWTGHTISGTNNNWTAIASSADGSKLAAVASGDYIYTSQDGGENWVQYNGQGTQSWYSVVSSADGLRMAAVAASNYIYTSSNGGSTWDRRLNDATRSWRAIAASSNGTKLAAVGSGLKVWTSGDSGVSWKEQASDALNWRAIASSADGTNLAAVVDGGYIYTSSNSGLSWVTSLGDSSRAWRAIASSSNGQYLAAVANSGYIYTSSNSGANWTERRPVNSTTRAWSSITSSPDGSKLVAVVNSGFIYTSNDYGVTWTEQQKSSTRKWCAMTASQNGNYLAATVNNGFIYTSQDKGLTWQERTGAGNRTWSAITSTADGRKLTATVNNGYIYQCTDFTSGDSWSEQRPISAASLWQGITSSADGSRLAAVADTGYIYTKNGAASWTAYKNDITRSWRAIASSGDGSKLAAAISGSRVIYASSDYGVSWPVEPYISDKSLSWNAISSSTDGNILAATAEEPPLKGYIYISTDSGHTWQNRTPAGSQVWKSISMSADGGLMAAVAYNDYIYTSIDQGVSWVPRTRLGLRSWRAVVVSLDGAFIGAAAENEINVFTCY